VRAKLPQNFKNAIKSQHTSRICLTFQAQNYHKISKMQSNHNDSGLNFVGLKRKITTKFQKCNQITTQISITKVISDIVRKEMKSLGWECD